MTRMQGGVFQLLRLDLRKAAQGILGRNFDEGAAFGQNQIAVRAGECPPLIVEGKVDGAVFHGMVKVVVAADGYLHIDLGIFFRKLRNGLRKFTAVVALVAAQAKNAAVIRVQPLGLPDELLQVAADDEAFAVKILSGARKAEGAVVAIQKLHAQLVL